MLYLLMRQYNIAQNGRWGVAAMAAIALHQGAVALAIMFALTLFFAHVLEQMSDAYRRPGYICVLVWTMSAILALMWHVRP